MTPLGEPEIRELGLSAPGEQDVFRLEVAVDQTQGGACEGFALAFSGYLPSH